MSKPSLDLLAVEPFEAGAIVYAPMAAPASWQMEQGRMMLLLTIRNSESTTLQVQDLRVVLSGPGAYPTKTFSLNLTIDSSGTASWCSQGPTDSLLFPSVPTPTGVRLEFSAVGFSEPATFTFPLRPHVTPTVTGAYQFPALASDLRSEYWFTNGDSHGVGAWASQAFGYDMDVRNSNGEWLRSGTGGTENEDFRVWGKGIHAMADGEVRQALSDVPTNPKPLTGPNWDQELAAQKAAVWGKWLEDNGFDPDIDEPHAGAGNHLYLQHGDEIVLYAHLQKGTISEHLLSEGAPVAAGELLGLAGNSGNSSAPHLHVHAIQGTEAETGPLRPLLFAPFSVVETSLISVSPTPWTVAFSGHALPPVNAYIWPSFELQGEFAAVDPLSLVLSNAVYVRLKLPNPPPISILLRLTEQIMANTSLSERREALARLHVAIGALGSVAQTIESLGE